ncbi:hypothetical protein GCM10010275_71890 [Streptomyces litmocidini]|uniref:hypothetical protein n=1 Tax=Streptomyces litmocidini TaxID=67318 RepID=UPI00167CC04F|nr:hypothetical protein [Streptomyces litmocidini]GGV19843.1 hypothetical protein GCM10010275_71890 [Streptomyces litmocidini]
MTRFLKAGDHVLITAGFGAGETREITSVRMFATDSGYYLRGGDGLYEHRNVALARERTGNPCDTRSHDLIDTCDHCRGICR